MRRKASIDPRLKKLRALTSGLVAKKVEYHRGLLSLDAFEPNNVDNLLKRSLAADLLMAHLDRYLFEFLDVLEGNK